MWRVFQNVGFTIPGAPTTFYGDEAGATNEGSLVAIRTDP